MKKYTFEELIKNYETNPNYQLDLIKNDCYNDTLDLLKQVRHATLEECANKADTCEEAVMRGHRIIVDKDTILDLDKDSIEVDE